MATILGTSGSNTLNGTAGNDLILGNGGADTINGNGGADIIIAGAGGSDTITGGTGADKLVLDGNYGDYTISFSGSNVVFTNGATVETVTGVEEVVFADRIVHVVGAGSENTTVQSGVDASSDGDVVVVAPGTYAEDVLFSKAVTVLGAKLGLAGTDGGRDAAAGVGETTIVGNNKITAAGVVTIDGIRFLNDATTTLGGASNPTLQVTTGHNHVITNNVFWSTVNGGANGVDDRAISFITLGAGDMEVSDNFISGTFASGFAGASWGRGIWFDGAGQNLDVTGNTIQYARTAVNLDMTGSSTADLANNTFHTTGTAVSVGVDADGVTFNGNTHTSVGTDFNYRNIGSFTLDLESPDIAIAGVSPGTDTVLVTGGAGNDTILGSSFNDVLDDNAAGSPFDSDTTADTDTLNGRGGNDILVAENGTDTLIGGTGNDQMDGGAGNDTLTGGADNDTIQGGANTDTAIYSGNLADYSIVGTPTNFTITDLRGGAPDGVDTVQNVEFLQFADGTVPTSGLLNPVKLFDAGDVLVGGFTTIQAAVDAALANYTIVVSAGAYAETVTVNKDVTIEGANVGIDAGGARGAESVLTGGFNVTVAGVTIDGMRVEEGASMSGELAGVFVQANNATVQNTVFTRSGTVDGDGSRGVVTATGSITGLSVSGNSFAGFHTGVYLNPDAAGTVSSNSFNTNFVGLSSDTNNPSLVAVTSNTFTNNGFEQVGLGILAASADLTSFGTGSTFTGSAPKISIYGLSGDGQSITGTVFDDTYNGDADDETFNGGAGNDTILGDAGDDTLNGGLGDDAMTGGMGNDTYSVDNAGDTVTENSGEGTDTINTSVALTLSALQSIEFLNSTGSGIALTGNAFAQTITGDAGSNTINGGGGGDTLNGAGGTDTLTGGAGNDTLDGGAGVDSMAGGTDNDTYTVDSASDVVTEAAGEGTDLVLSSATYIIGANVENLTLTGTANIAGTGNAGANTLTGNSGNNSLNGGAGIDTMIGGLGNDIYLVDNAADVVTELAGQGTDQVSSSITFSLVGLEIENLTLFGGATINGTGNDFNNLMFGNGAVNTISGGLGNDTINGGAGNDTLNGGDGNDALNGEAGVDTMVGGVGNDTYNVDNTLDVITELGGEGTLDVAVASATYTLSANVERLTLSGASAINGTGNATDNIILGNGAANTLNGAGGNDTLSAGAGADTLIGGAGGDSMSGGSEADNFHFDITSVDVAQDFVAGSDKIVVSASAFGGGLVMGGGVTLHANSAPVAIGAGGQFLYDTDDGFMYFDADGAGGAAAVQFGRLIGAPTIAASDFVVIA